PVAGSRLLLAGIVGLRLVRAQHNRRASRGCRGGAAESAKEIAPAHRCSWLFMHRRSSLAPARPSSCAPSRLDGEAFGFDVDENPSDRTDRAIEVGGIR